MVKIHALKNGATIIHTSPSHGMRFSDGTEIPPQDKDVCDTLTCKRVFRERGNIKGMMVTEMRMELDDGQLDFLRQLCDAADLVIIPFPVLTALREMGVRRNFPNAVCTIATKETERSAPADKVWDADKWSY